MLIEQTDYLWKRGQLEDVALTAEPFIFTPKKPVRIFKFDSADYTGEITILETEDATEPLYQGTLPYIPNEPIACDSLVLVLPESEEAISATIHLVAEVGTVKAILIPYLNTTEGMIAVNSSYNDDGTYSISGIGDFFFNGIAASTIYISSNHWLGFGSSTEHLKICRRDGCSTTIYRQTISLADEMEVLKIRFEGYTVYNNRIASNRLIFEVFLISNNDMFLNIITTPTSGNTGTSELICNGTTTALDLNVGSADGAMVSFYHLDDTGKTWNIVYEMYNRTGIFTQLYLLRLEDTFYTVADGAMAALELTELSAVAFLEHGFEGLPSAELLTPLVNTAMTDLQKEQIITMRKQKTKYTDISQAVGVPVNTIKTFCRRNGLATESAPNKPVCKNCGSPLTLTPKARPRLFCSDHCKQSWWNKHRHERASTKIVPHTCPTCGKLFADYSGANRKYCSQECYRERGAHDGQ